jgi:hypothetical protein
VAVHPLELNGVESNCNPHMPARVCASSDRQKLLLLNGAVLHCTERNATVLQHTVLYCIALIYIGVCCVVRYLYAGCYQEEAAAAAGLHQFLCWQTELGAVCKAVGPYVAIPSIL